MRRLSGKTKFRVTFLFIGLIIASVVFVSTAFSYVSQIEKTKKEINDLKITYNDTLSTEEALKDEQIKRLKQKVWELVLDMDILKEANKLRPFVASSPSWKSGE